MDEYEMNENRVLNFLKKQWKNITIIIVVLVLCFVSNQIYIRYANKTADIDYINSVLQKSSELTTAKIITTGIYHYKDTGVRIFNRSDFTMVYTVEVRAGIDLEKVEVKKDDNEKIISVSIPKAEILDTHIKDINYYDSKFSLFNSDAKEDGEKARRLAETKTGADAKETGILELADSQSKTLIKGILSDAVPDGYKI